MSPVKRFRDEGESLIRDEQEGLATEKVRRSPWPHEATRLAASIFTVFLTISGMMRDALQSTTRGFVRPAPTRHEVRPNKEEPATPSAGASTKLLHEKGGKRHDVPAHHRAEEAVEAYLAAGGVDAGVDVLPHVSGDGDHGVPVERGDARARAADRRARVAEDDEAVRPDGGHDLARRDRAHRDLA